MESLDFIIQTFLVDTTEKIIFKFLLTSPMIFDMMIKFRSLLQESSFMENQFLKDSEKIRDHAIDRLHELVEMGDYVSACSVYEEFRDVILNINETSIVYK